MSNAATVRTLAPGDNERTRGRLVAVATGAGLAFAAATAVSLVAPSGSAHAIPISLKTPPAQSKPAIAAIRTAVTPAQIAPAAPAPGLSYTVKSGDTVSRIAARTGTSVSRIVAANGLNAKAMIRIGQTLSIPSSTAAAPAPTAAPAGRYTVKAGDTTSAIAKRHGTTVSAIVAANGLNAKAMIRIGQQLTIPGSAAVAPAQPAAPAAPAVAPAGRYTVKAGDTTSAIAKRHGTTVSAIVAANGLNAKAMIRIGQQLTIPGATAAATPAPTVGNTFAGRTYPQATVDAANANKAALTARSVPSKAEMRQMVTNTARQMGVDPALALAIAHQESGFNMRAVSPANAIGAMQVIPSSGRWASDLVGRQLDLLNPQDNVTAGVAIIRQLMRSAPDEASAIAGYYQGLSSVKKNGMYNDTRRYVANIQTLRASFR